MCVRFVGAGGLFALVVQEAGVGGAAAGEVRFANRRLFRKSLQFAQEKKVAM